VKANFSNGPKGGERNMKTFNWLTLNQFSIDDLVIFMHWLGFTSKGAATPNQLRTQSAVRSSKLPELTKILNYFEFAAKAGDKIQITHDGRDFNRANTNLKIEMLKSRIAADEVIQKVLFFLEQSPTGRLTTNAIVEILQEGYVLHISGSDVVGLLNWASTCKIFSYDKEHHEIVRLGGRLPQNPLSPGLAS
jgi:hypothetical protein